MKSELVNYYTDELCLLRCCDSIESTILMYKGIVGRQATINPYEWVHSDYIINLLIVATDNHKLSVVDCILKKLSIPDNLTLKEQIAYYQLIGK